MNCAYCLKYISGATRNQVTYFRVSLKRNDPSDAAKNDDFVTRVRKYPHCENAALRKPSASSDIQTRNIRRAI